MLIHGSKEGAEKQCLVYTLVDHQECFAKYGASATDFMAAAALVSGAVLVSLGPWKKPGIHMVAEFDPLPFLKELKNQGFTYKFLDDAPELDVISGSSDEE